MVTWTHPRLVALTLALVLLGACNAPHDPTVVDRLDCNRCHADLYDTVPRHMELNAPRECYRCHGTLDWAEVEPTHDRFPIGRGSHRGYDCAACHLSQEDRTDITCIDCHEHREGRVRPFHLGVSEFTYQPRSCFECHPGG